MGEGKVDREKSASLGDERTAFPEQGTLPSEDLRLRRSKSHIGTAETLPPPPFEEPSSERYALVRELGRGGMGRVDEVFDAKLGRAVARKASLTVAPDVRATMLVAEAQTCAQLEHPAIVPVYDVGSDDFGQPYYTMRNVRGRTLGHVIDDNANPEREHKTLAQMLSILRQVCLAVDYAHSRGVVHRDLKPDNVIVGEFGEVYVLDWGIALVMGGSDVRRTAMEDVVAGSPGYMAPEQALGKEVDGRADVFALGAILYEILTGQVPFEDSDFRSIQLRAHSRLQVPPSRRNPLVATSFDTLVAACLEPDPEERLPSSRFIADAIDVFLDGERERAERERDAASYTAAGDAARGAFVLLDRESRRLKEEAESSLESIPKWDQGERKEEAWGKG
ncbi:MAG TPA: serine/threonine-protein kinase [Polyangiaceae bacterium]